MDVHAAYRSLINYDSDELPRPMDDVQLARWYELHRDEVIAFAARDMYTYYAAKLVLAFDDDPEMILLADQSLRRVAAERRRLQS
jgi:hypothetical protein